MKNIKTKGFTLIELLIVIGILAVLATTVVLVLNPAQILAETRDTQRISDLGSVNSAIGLYLATVSNPNLGSILGGVNGSCGGGNFYSWRSSGAGSPLAAVPTANSPFVTPSGFTATSGSVSMPASGFRNVDGTGWISTDLNNISGGSPLANLPSDPSAATASAVAPLSGDGSLGHFYAFQCGGGAATSTQFELDANMESVKFSGGTTPGSADVEGNDGGNQATVYEVGNAPGLAL